MLLRPGLSRGQQAFVLGREVAFNYLKLAERPYVSSSPQVRSFEEVLNNFKASYFAGALLMEEESLLRDVKKVFAAKKWSPDLLLGLMTQLRREPRDVYAAPHHAAAAPLRPAKPVFPALRPNQ